MNREMATDTPYLEHELAFINNDFLKAWPTSGNRFIERMAFQVKAGFSGKMTVSDFMSLIAATTESRPHDCFTFFVSLDEVLANSTVYFTVVSREYAVEPPITSDNAGFFEFAIRWFAENGTNDLLIGFSADNLFWVHR